MATNYQPKPASFGLLGHTAKLAACLFLCLTTITPATAAETNNAPLWQALRAGTAFAIMRHAIAPGGGDPAEFTLNDCSTQRNLSDDGRAQARTAGALFRANDIADAHVFTSQWCRCRETAVLLGFDPAQDLPPLNSFFQNWDRRAPQTDALKSWLQSRPTDKPLILVTHQVNISALTGTSPRSGEILFVKPSPYSGPDSEYTVLGRIIP